MSIKEEKSEELTIEKLRTYKGLETLTDDEAREAIYTLEVLANLLMESVLKDNYE